jgi:hypothetical protein
MRFKKHVDKFEVPIVGKYNVKFKATEERVKGLSFSQNIKQTKSRKHEVESIFNTSPICGRMIRALNSKSNEQRVGMFMNLIYSTI